jgi:hypothetical protein
MFSEPDGGLNFNFSFLYAQNESMGTYYCCLHVMFFSGGVAGMQLNFWEDAHGPMLYYSEGLSSKQSYLSRYTVSADVWLSNMMMN